MIFWTNGGKFETSFFVSTSWTSAFRKTRTRELFIRGAPNGLGLGPTLTDVSDSLNGFVRTTQDQGFTRRRGIFPVPIFSQPVGVGILYADHGETFSSAANPQSTTSSQAVASTWGIVWGSS